MLAWLFARSAGSAFTMRVDDVTTTPHPDRAEVALRQLRDLHALGLDWDGPVSYQSDRVAQYNAVIEPLIADDRAYPCFCTRAEIRREIEAAATAPHANHMADAYPGTCGRLSSRQRADRRSGRPPALRVRAGGVVVSVTDGSGPTVQKAIDDFVIRRSDGQVAYNLAVVVDDLIQGVEQIVRGDDLLETTPRHAFLFDLLGEPRPSWHHVPLVVSPDGTRLAKRDGAVTMDDLAATGIGAAEVVRLVLRSIGLGECETLGEAVAIFDPSLIPADPWVFDPPTPGLR